MRHALCPCLLVACVLSVPAFAQILNPTPGAPAGPKISDEERKALEKVNTAVDTTAKLSAAGEYLKKFGKSPMRPRLAGHLVNEISKVQDNAQRITLAQSFVAAFDHPEEANLVKPTVIDALVKESKFDEAFAEGAKYLPNHPNDVLVLTQLAIVGVEQAKAQNTKYVQVSQQYAAKAVALMETDQKPADFDAPGWKEYSGQWLPRLYQAQGVILYLTNDRPASKERFEKAVALEAQNPSTLMMLGMLADDDYQALAKQFNAEKAGPGKDAMLKQAFTKMDEVIDWFARAVAASDGRAEFQAMNQQLRQNLEAYFKFRNNGSVEGMGKLIDKYKKPAGQ